MKMIQGLLRHSNYNFTADTYVHVDEDSMRAMMNTISQGLNSYRTVLESVKHRVLFAKEKMTQTSLFEPFFGCGGYGDLSSRPKEKKPP